VVKKLLLIDVEFDKNISKEGIQPQFPQKGLDKLHRIKQQLVKDFKNL